MSSQLPRLGIMGISGVGQMSPASQSILSRAAGPGRGLRNGGRKRKRSSAKKKGVRASGARKRKSSSSRKAYMVKGSAAAKKYMAKLRRMRKK